MFQAFYLAITTSVLSLALSLQSEVVTRGSLDIGSGEIKLTIADVDTDLNQIVDIWYQNIKKVELQKDFAKSLDGNLSKNIEESLIQALQELKTESSHLNPIDWYGVGTSVFRKAKNGQEILDRIKNEEDITIDLISREEEGSIGFLTAVAVSKLDYDEVIAWDSGTGSFQVSTVINNEFNVYGAEFAFVPTLETLLANRGQPFSSKLCFNPISHDEVLELVKSICKKLPPTPEWLSKTPKKIISIGGKRSIFEVGKIATGQDCYTTEQIREILEEMAGRANSDFYSHDEPETVIIGLTLLYAVMKHCKMGSVTYFRTNGVCEGLLITPQYWKQKEKN